MSLSGLPFPVMRTRRGTSGKKGFRRMFKEKCTMPLPGLASSTRQPFEQLLHIHLGSNDHGLSFLQLHRDSPCRQTGLKRGLVCEEVLSLCRGVVSQLRHRHIQPRDKSFLVRDFYGRRLPLEEECHRWTEEQSEEEASTQAERKNLTERLLLHGGEQPRPQNGEG